MITCMNLHYLPLLIGVCKSNESESVSVLCYELVFHHKWADAQFFMADAQFFWRMRSFSGWMCSFLLWDCFDL